MFIIARKHITITSYFVGRCIALESYSNRARIAIVIGPLRKHFFSAHTVNIWNSLPNSVVDACTVNAFKALLDNFWQHQLVKFDFTADLTCTGNRSEEVIK